MVNKQVEIKADKYSGLLDIYEHGVFSEINIQPRPAMLVLPGGAYAYCSTRENEPVALEFFNRGYNVYALTYPTAPNRFPSSLAVAAAAADYIRNRAKESYTNPDKLFAIGFSAGGHLCASLANCPPDFPAVKGYNFKPNGVVLCYPVIRESPGHRGSFENLLGDKIKDRSPELAWLDLDTSVRPDNPPAFIWTTAADGAVAPINSIMYATAYNNLKLKYELHVYPYGEHGLSLADTRMNPDSVKALKKVTTWVDFADEFLRSLS